MANDSRFIKAIYSIMDALKSSTQLAESMESSLNILCSILECKSGSFWMQSIEEKRVYVIASNGPEDKTGYSVNIGEGIIGAVHQSGLREIVKDGMHDPRTADTDDASLFGSLSLVVPMKTPHGSYGVLLLNDPSRPFDEDTIRVAENCCAFIALDIEEKGLAFKPIKNKNILVSLRDVIKEFQNGDELHRVLKGIDLDVYEGELLVVLGESGCGQYGSCVCLWNQPHRLPESQKTHVPRCCRIRACFWQAFSLYANNLSFFINFILTIVLFRLYWNYR